MKTLRTIMVNFVMMGITVGAATAQAGCMRANVPFDFGVAGKTVSAGEYTLLTTSREVRVISTAQSRTVAVVLVNQISGRSAGENGRVIFRCHRHRCFLAEVWAPGEE